MEFNRTFHAANLEEWRAWLQQHQTDQAEVWLIFDKAHTGTACISYEDAIREALCFGWVDSLIQKIDADHYARKFSPRRMNSAWSELNKRRVREMVRQGRMTPAGLDKVTFPLDEKEDQPPPLRQIDLPDEMLARIQTNPNAWANFNRLPPSHRRRYTGWVMSAKQEQTRQKRLDEVIDVLAQGKPLGMK